MISEDREDTESMPLCPAVSVVLPVFNEEANLAELHRRLVAALAPLGESFELLFVDDGSSDGSLAVLRSLAVSEPRVKVIAFSRNFGHQIALTAGLDHAAGDAVVLMDSDLQDPPELIPQMVARFKEGVDVVYAQRRRRPGESGFKRATAYAFYRILRRISEVDIPPDTGDFRLLSRRAADALRGLRERKRFLRGLTSWTGFRRAAVLYDRPARTGGESKYRFWSMLRFALVGTFSFSDAPISLVGAAGAFVGVAALSAWVAGFLAPYVAALFFLGAVQLVALWVLGQYVAAIAEEVRARPLYLVAEALNCQSSTESNVTGAA